MRILLKTLSWLFDALPLPVTLACGRGLGRLVALVMAGRRREAAENITRCIPRIPLPEARRLVWRMYANLGMNVVETLRMARRPPAEIRGLIDLGDLEQVVARLIAPGKGLLVLTAHVGNWEYFATASAGYGYPLGIIVKDLRPESLNTYITEMRALHGTTVFSRRGSLRRALKHVKDNGILGFLLDQNAKRDEGVFVDFFGQTACTNIGLAQIARVTGATTLPVFLIRQPGGRFKSLAFPPIPPPADGSEEEIRRHVQACTSVTEEVIRQHPDQWIWMHRRWRTKPAPPGTETPAPAASAGSV